MIPFSPVFLVPVLNLTHVLAQKVCKIKDKDKKEPDDGDYREGVISFGEETPVAAKRLPLPVPTGPLKFSPEAKTVMDAGRELWRYYQSRPDADPNASLYDIRLYFQGYKTIKSGRIQMNTGSTDVRYMEILTRLREALKVLPKAIEPKVYEYGFLLR